MQYRQTRLLTPLGGMLALWGERGLLALTWTDRQPDADRHLLRHGPTVDASEVECIPELSAAVAAYLDGDIAALVALPVNPPGTGFQRTVWAALREIPAGQTWSYGDLARHIGRPTAFRAVAQANGANPVPLVIPCHRVIAGDGSLGGFSAGLDRKRWLLNHEKAWSAPGD